MKVEIGAEAALFPEKEYISGIFLAVYENCTEKEKKSELTFSMKGTVRPDWIFMRVVSLDRP